MEIEEKNIKCGKTEEVSISKEKEVVTKEKEKEEVTTHWKQNFCRYFKQIGRVAILSSGCFVVSFIIGSTSLLPEILSTPNSEQKFTNDDLKWLASLPILIGIPGSLFATVFSNKFGPLRLFRWIQPIVAVFYLLIAFKPSLEIMYFARLGLGVVAGFFDVIVYSLIAEITEPSLRGFSSALADITTSSAILLTYILLPLLPHKSAILCFLIPVLIGYLGSFVVPESPYWLARNGETQEAAKILQRTFMSSEEEVKEILVNFKAEKELSIKMQGYFLRKKQNWKPVLLSASVFILKEVGGNSAILFYALFIFKRARPSISAFTCTVLVGVLRLAGSFVSSFLHDRLGRRPLLIGTFLVAGITMALGGFFLVRDFSDGGWVPLVCLLIFTASVGIGPGPIPFIILGELMPSRIRLLGSGIVLAIFYFTQFIIVTVIPPLVNSISLGLTLVIFGIVDLIAVIFFWAFIPETKNKSLIQIENSFKNKNSSRSQPTTALEGNINKTFII